jgi:RNA 3'-terminal phosphate cyclase (ATP)
MATNGVIDEYLADQLLLPLAFASGRSHFRSAKLTNHLITNAELIKEFINVEIDFDGEIGQPGLVTIQPCT